MHHYTQGKPTTQAHKGIPEGMYEEEQGQGGFFGPVSHLIKEKPSTRWVEIEHIGSIEAYSEFCIKELTNYVDTDYVLLIQYDGFILNPQSWSDEFLEYDYVGAPIFISNESLCEKYGIPTEYIGRHVTGNGGFSLRSRRFIETSAKLAAQGKFAKYHPEDLVLCLYDQQLLLNEGIRFAPTELAQDFSIEGRLKVYRSQFGFHSFNHTNISDWISQNPQHGIRLNFTLKPGKKSHPVVWLFRKLKRLLMGKSWK